jgi:hypothetical protein
MWSRSTQHTERKPSHTTEIFFATPGGFDRQQDVHPKTSQHPPVFGLSMMFLTKAKGQEAFSFGLTCPRTPADTARRKDH